MKKFIRIIMLTLLVTATAMSASAQKNKKGKDRRHVSREQLAETQAKYIADELAFDQATTTKFVSTFCNFQKEMWALGPRPKSQKAGTEEESKKSIESSFDHSQKFLDLRRKYYKEYSKFLTQKQIERVYELEMKMMKHLGRGQGDKGDRPKSKASKKRPDRQKRYRRSCPPGPCPVDSAATPNAAN